MGGVEVLLGFWTSLLLGWSDRVLLDQCFVESPVRMVWLCLAGSVFCGVSC